MGTKVDRAKLAGALLLALTLMPSMALGEAIPNAFLDVTAQQKEDGRLSPALHIFKLSCWDGECSLTTTTLNQCIGGAFYPKVERHSTAGGDLRIHNERNTLVAAVDWAGHGGAATLVLRFTYLPPRAKGDAATELAGFSGGFVKNSRILEKTLTVQYIPLVGWQNRTLDCQVSLPGVLPEALQPSVDRRGPRR